MTCNWCKLALKKCRCKIYLFPIPLITNVDTRISMEKIWMSLFSKLYCCGILFTMTIIDHQIFFLQDLLQVPSGQLAQSLKKSIKFATKHVFECPLCSGKGFICELCHNPKVIYPFQTDDTIRVGVIPL